MLHNACIDQISDLYQSVKELLLVKKCNSTIVEIIGNLEVCGEKLLMCLLNITHPISWEKMSQIFIAPPPTAETLCWKRKEPLAPDSWKKCLFCGLTLVPEAGNEQESDWENLPCAWEMSSVCKQNVPMLPIKGSPKAEWSPWKYKAQVLVIY